MTWPLAPLQRAKYRTIVVDPPWKFSAGTKGRPQHYPRMTDAEIGALPIRDLAHPDGANIFLWVTSPKAFHIPAIVQAWRLRYSGRAFVWIKTHAVMARGGEPLFLHRDSLHTGTGFTTRKNAEDCLLLKIGKPPRLSKKTHEIIVSPVREHSRKPDEFYRRVEGFSAGPYADIFARQPREGWDVFGNEANKFAVPA